MKAANQQNQPPNKKLILHFDIDGVLRLPTRKNKDLHVYDACADWVWGKLEKNSKEDPDKVTGWKLASNQLSQEAPEADTLSYKQYLKEYVKPDAEEWEKLILNLSKGPAGKAKAEIEKTIKNITIPKPLHDILKEIAEPANNLEKQYISSGKYEILPAFYKLFLSLKKNKREFAISVKTDNKNTFHHEVISELNLFFTGEHPLYNGKNGTPLVKMDGTNKCKNFVFEDSHFMVMYEISQGEEKEYVASFGTQNCVEEKDAEMLKQTLKSNKRIKVCDNAGEIYSYFHSILAESACIYQLNPTGALIIDGVDYLTQEIYFSTRREPNIYNAVGEKVQKSDCFFQQVSEFELLRDVDYFIKKVEKKESERALEIQKIQKGEENQQAEEEKGEEAQGEEKEEESSKKINKEPTESDADYLKRTILPILDGAFRQVDLLRPSDPVGFIALYCLKNKDRVEG